MTGLRAELQHARTLTGTRSHRHVCTCLPSPLGPGLPASGTRRHSGLHTCRLSPPSLAPGRTLRGTRPAAVTRTTCPPCPGRSAAVVSGVCLPGLCQCRKRVSYGSDPRTQAPHPGAAPPSQKGPLPLGRSSVHLKSPLSGLALPQPTQASCPQLFTLNLSGSQYFWSQGVGPAVRSSLPSPLLWCAQPLPLTAAVLGRRWACRSTACFRLPLQAALSLLLLPSLGDSSPPSRSMVIRTLAFQHYLAVAALETRRRQWHPTPVLLPGKSHGWRSLEGCSP